MPFKLVIPEPTTAELDQAVARVLGLKWVSTMGWMLPNKGGSSGYRLELYLDYNALAAARASLEAEAGYHIFQRDVGGAWQYWGEISMIGEFAFVGGDLASEALACAQCIKAVSDGN